jgi:hypothetical protein
MTVAATTVAALGDVTRVAHPRPRMKSLGLIPRNILRVSVAGRGP